MPPPPPTVRKIHSRPASCFKLVYLFPFVALPEVNEPPEMTTGHSQKGFLPDEQKPVNKVVGIGVGVALERIARMGG